MGEGALGRLVPLSYPAATLGSPSTDGALLCDLTGHGSLLMSGPSSPQFVAAAFAGRLLAIGEVSLEAVLTGDGALVSVALLARTGDAEYACWDLTGTGDALHAWLSFLSNVEQGGSRVFPELSIEDASEALVPLLLWGNYASTVLSDYTANQAIPAAGTIASLNLDAIGCLVAAPRLGAEPAFLVLVPPRYARVLWRSFLSFPAVMPVGKLDLVSYVASLYPQLGDLSVSGQRVVVSGAALAEAGLIREERNFVGARGLS